MFRPLTVLALLTVTGLADGQSYDIDIFRLEGQSAPGSGASYQGFDRPNITAAGSVAFTADTDGPTDSDDCVYIGDTLVALQGQAASGTAGTFQSFDTFATAQHANLGGLVAYIATLAGVPTTENRAIYLEQGLVFREGEDAPDAGGALFVDFDYLNLLDDGSVGFIADLDSAAATDSAIYRGNELLFRQGDPIVGGGPFDGATWDGDFDELAFNGIGDFIFEGNTDLSPNDQGIFRVTPFGLELLLREGDAVDAHTGPDQIELFLQIAISEGNFLWVVRGNLAVAPSDFDAVIIGPLGVVAQQGDEIPELTGAVLGNFNAVDINSDGDVVYLADIEGAADPAIDEGIFLNGALIVTTGEPIPALDPGTVFTDIGFEDVFIDENGLIVFAANYNDGVGTAEDGVFLAVPEFPAPITFRRGDSNGDGVFNALVDGLYLLNFGFVTGAPVPPCLDAADTNDDGTLNALVDALAILSFGFVAGSPPPPTPGPFDCGPDPTADNVGCDNPPPCP